MTRADLISDAYLEEQRILHAAPRGYGQRGDKWAKTVTALANKHRVATILDYGCGQGALADALAGTREVAEYDPAIDGKDVPPTTPFDLVVCTDVLEHVEEDRIDAVLDHLASLTLRYIVVVVSLVPTAKTLSDGRQAHILLRCKAWWQRRFVAHGFALRHELASPDQSKSFKEFAALYKRLGRLR